MKSIQKLFALSLMIFLSINLATAQRGNKSEDAEVRAQKQTERMTEQLSLTASQTEQVAEINLAYAQKMKAIKADNTDKEATKAAMKPLRAEKQEAIKAVLTPEQLAKYNEQKQSKRGGKGKGGKKAK